MNQEFYAILTLSSNLICDSDAGATFEQLAQSDLCQHWPTLGGLTDEGIALLNISFKHETRQQIQLDYTRLFLGAIAEGQVLAPPWGSVYTSDSQQLQGPSTQRLTEFLNSNRIRVTPPPGCGPLDNLGTLLAITAHLLGQRRHATALALLDQHLLGWCDRMLFTLQEQATTHFYRGASLLIRDLIPRVSNDLRRASGGDVHEPAD